MGKKGSTTTSSSAATLKPDRTKAKRVRGPFVTNAAFVKTYAEGIHAGKTVADIARALGLSEGSVNSRASVLRKKGVRLPSPTGVREKVDAGALNAMIDGLNGQS